MHRPTDVRMSRFAHGHSPHRPTRSWTLWLAAPGIAALVAEPALWLWRSWLDPAYQSDGMLVAGVVAALLAVSLASGYALPDPCDRRLAFWALGVTALVRLGGRLLAVSTIGALALVVDVWAASVLLRVERRPFSLRPLGVALLFAFALPVEHLAQRILGHPMQLAAATASEWVLWPFFPELAREGVLLVHPDVALAVDLPCSGARGLVLLATLALALFARRRPGLLGGCLGAAAVVLGAFTANALRIIALFVGGAYDVPVIEEPWHSLVGAGVLAIGAIPLLVLGMRSPARRPTRAPLGPGTGIYAGSPIGARARRPLPWGLAVAIGCGGLAIAHAPQRPLDVSKHVEPVPLPTSLGRFDGLDVPLLEHEAGYYTRWGGFAQKRIYDDRAGDPVTALLVRTRSPLRHLHGPDTCLAGAGHRVTRVGVVPRATPAVLYRSVAPDGRVWRVEASFVSDRGEAATSVSEVVWRWLEEPDTTWSLIERITPWTACEANPERCLEFEGALLASLDLPVEKRR
jgi:exosortase/archaeosortase family protein